MMGKITDNNVIVITYEELIFGIFRGLSSNLKGTAFISYIEFSVYENAVIDYFSGKNLDIIVNTSEKDKEDFKEKHPEFVYDENGITLDGILNCSILGTISDEKREALFRPEAIQAVINYQSNSKDYQKVYRNLARIA